MSIRSLFWLLIALALVVPLAGIGGLRLYEVSLLRTTERQLIAQSVALGEFYREALALGKTESRPPGVDDRFVPREPRITADTEYIPSLTTLQDCQPALEQSFSQLERVLKQAQLQNLSSVSVLDTQGCALASTGTQAAKDFSVAPEVKRALNGFYGSALRKRSSDEPIPPLGSIRRRGRSRVFTALPIFSDGQLVGVIRASRTGLDPISRIFQQRRSSLSLVAVCLFALFVLAVAGSASIVRPLRSLTEHARKLKAGAEHLRWRPNWLAPKETVLLGKVLDDASEELRLRADAISEFARDVSHELKTPITAVLGASELLRDSGPSMTQEQRERFAENIAQDAARMSRLVERLLILARLDHPSAFRETSPVDLQELFEREAAKDAAIHLIIEGEPQPFRAQADHLQSLLGNLLDNALLHGAGPIEVKLSYHPQQLIFSVSDCGPGMSEAVQAQIYEPFFTTARNSGGSGLGLSIVRALVLGLGGTIALTSSEQGSCFEVKLPCAEA